MTTAITYTTIHIRSTDSSPTVANQYTLESPAIGIFELSWYRFSDLNQPWIWAAIDGIQIGGTLVHLCQGAAYLAHVDTATTATAIQTALINDHAAGSTCVYNATTNNYDCTIPVAQNILWTNVNSTSAGVFEKIADEGPTATFSLPSWYVTSRPAKLDWHMSNVQNLSIATNINDTDFHSTMDNEIIPGQRINFTPAILTFVLTPHISHSPSEIYPIVGLWDLIFIRAY